jgi:dTDP-4-amino-4,6-dideoxygalactose transaminase
VHLYGQLAPMPEILEVAAAHGLPVVEDACQAHGARLWGRPAGSWGTIACFSFYPSKNLGAAGEGGFAVTGSADLAARMRQVADHGQARRYEHAVPGYNFRLPAIQAAILRAKLPRLDGWNARRREIAARYTEGLRETDLGLPYTAPGAEHVYHLYVVRSANRDQLGERLRAEGVATGVHYPIPVHEQPAFAGNLRVVGSLAHTEAAAREVLSLPMYPQLTDEQVDEIAGKVRALTSDLALAAR